MPITWLDLILIAIMLISAFLAMLRGLTREMLSIMSWALAALAALFMFKPYQERIEKYIEPKLLADGILIVTVFVVVLVVVSLITVRVSDRVLDSRVGAIDRTLGFVFGLVRGLLLVAIAYELYTAIVPEPTLPPWVTEAMSKPTIKTIGTGLRTLLPDNPESIFQKKERKSAAPSRDTVAALNVTEIISNRLDRDYKGSVG